MIKKFTLISIHCDNCNEHYPSRKEPIHFADIESANKTLRENGWTTGESHVCPECISAAKFVTSYFKRDEN